MDTRNLIIETLLKEATEDEKNAARALQVAVNSLTSDLQANKDEVAPEIQNESLTFAIAGSIVSAPALLKIFGKAAAKVEGWVTGKKVETNAIIKVADKLHGLLIGGIEKALFFVKDKKARHRLAVILFHAIVAGLLIASGKALVGALAKHKTGMSIFEGVLSAIKSGELGTYLTATFGEIAEAIGLGAELLDAAELADAIELSDADLMETSTMGAGAVEGTACGLGKKADIYDTWNQNSLEETNMNKIKITKGRLRKIIAEEVSRHNQTKLNEMGVEEEEAEAAETAAETDAAEYMGQTDEAQLREVSPVSKPRDMNHLRKQIKETLEEMLSDDPIEEECQGTEETKLNEADVNWTKNDLLKHLSNNNSVSAADLKYAFKGSSQANSAALAKLADEGVLEKTGKRYKLASKDK